MLQYNDVVTSSGSVGSVQEFILDMHQNASNFVKMRTSRTCIVVHPNFSQHRQVG
jgi:hypothetical protein